MFWGAISNKAKSPLFSIDGSMDTDRYIALLSDEFLPWLSDNEIEMKFFK
jgi:hypothetical protein